MQILDRSEEERIIDSSAAVHGDGERYRPRETEDSFPVRITRIEYRPELWTSRDYDPSLADLSQDMQLLVVCECVVWLVDASCVAECLHQELGWELMYRGGYKVLLLCPGAPSE